MNHPSYVKCLGNLVFLMTALASGAVAGEKAIASLHDMSDVELKETGFTMQIGAPVHIKAVGAGGDYGWTYKSGDMFAYAWVINADTRQVVWEMTADKTSKVKSDRTLDGVINLPRDRMKCISARLSLPTTLRSPIFRSTSITGKIHFSGGTEGEERFFRLAQGLVVRRHRKRMEQAFEAMGHRPACRRVRSGMEFSTAEAA